MTLTKPRNLGRTGLKVGRLGVACSYGAPTAAFEEAFEQGVNYFYWGSMRKESMARAIRNIIGRGKRDELVMIVQSYSRSAILTDCYRFVMSHQAVDVCMSGPKNRQGKPRPRQQAACPRTGVNIVLQSTSFDRMPMAESAPTGLRPRHT